VNEYEIVFRVRADQQPTVRDLAEKLYEAWRGWANERPEGEDVPIMVGRQVRAA
jgi:hypothetical protein